MLETWDRNEWGLKTSKLKIYRYRYSDIVYILIKIFIIEKHKIYTKYLINIKLLEYSIFNNNK